MGKTKIEWATDVWNPVTGCTKVSAGCANCYAERMAPRFNGVIHPAPFSTVVLHPDRLEQPLHWRKPRRVFVCSMGDLFHPDIDGNFRSSVWHIMGRCPQHTFMVLTKRADRLWVIREPYYGTLPNVWLGVSVEDQAAADERIPLLLQTPAAVRFVSVEPMLGAVNLWALRDGSWYDAEGATRYNALTGAAWWGGTGDHGLGGGPKLDWIICGGESGPGARPMHPDWPRSPRDQCGAAGVPFLFKQWGEFVSVGGHSCTGDFGVWPDGSYHRLVGGEWPALGRAALMRRVGKKSAGRLLDGREWDEYPDRERQP